MCQGYNCEQDQLLAPVKLTSYLGSQKISKPYTETWLVAPLSMFKASHVACL